jgi:hypothetical protein
MPSFIQRPSRTRAEICETSLFSLGLLNAFAPRAIFVMTFALLLMSCSRREKSATDQDVDKLQKRISELERQLGDSAKPGATPEVNPFEQEERKDRYQLLKTDYAIQENLPEVISFFKEKKQNQDPSSIEAQTHQAILKLCEELSSIVPRIIAAKADRSVADLIARQREIFKSFDAILASEHTAELENRYHISEYQGELIRIDRETNQKVLDLLTR